MIYSLLTPFFWGAVAFIFLIWAMGGLLSLVLEILNWIRG